MDERETGELVNEKDLPSSAREVHDYLIERTQNMTKPVWIRVWRRRGIAHALDRSVEAPYRRGELGLVISKLEAMDLGGEKKESCIKIKYADGKIVVLPVMEYVWTDKTDGNVRQMFVDRKETD
jgi:hypothetical protein